MTHFDDFCAVGFQSGVPGRDDGCGKMLETMAALDIPVLMKCNNGANLILDTLQAHPRNEVVFRYAKKSGKACEKLWKIPGINHGFDPDIPDYNATPDTAASEQWRQHGLLLPPELWRYQDRVWVEIVNELDRNRADWIGQFLVSAAKIVIACGFKFCGPGWSSGEPEPWQWQTPGMLEYLRYCSENPDTCAVAVHQYSLNNKELQSGVDWGMIYRHWDIYDACDANNIYPYPEIIVTECGWGYRDCPDAANAVAQLDKIMPEFMADGIPVLLWTLDRGDTWGSVSERINQIMRQLPAYADRWQIPADDEIIIEEEPVTETFDLWQYVAGDGRQHEMQCNIGGGNSTETHQTQRQPWGMLQDEVYFHVKNRAWEQMYTDENYIYRSWDTSEAQDRFYGQFTIVDGWSILGAVWCPRYMKVGETFGRCPFIRHYLKSDCCLQEFDIVPSDIKFLDYRQQWTSKAGIAVGPVAVLGWIVNGEIQEKYYYALDFGLVRWWSRDAGESHICAIHHDRDDLVREQIDCMPVYELYYAPAPVVEPVPEEDLVESTRAFVLDISSHQGDLDDSDWEAIAGWRGPNGEYVQGVAIRASVGCGVTTDGRDKKFAQNWDGAGKVGLARTAYHVNVPNHDAYLQCQNFFGAVGNRLPEFPPVLDVELDNGMTKEAISDSVSSCQIEIEHKYYDCQIYTGAWFWNPHVKMVNLDDVIDLWVAVYPDAEKPLYGVAQIGKPYPIPNSWKTWKFWQFSSKAILPGITENTVDVNVFNGSPDEFYQYCAEYQTRLAALDEPEPEPIPEPSPGPGYDWSVMFGGLGEPPGRRTIQGVIELLGGACEEVGG